MGLEKKDVEMMAVSIPTIDWWDIRDDIERLANAVERLEKVLECFIVLYHEERVKSWGLILKELLRKEEIKKGNRKNGNRTR